MATSISPEVSARALSVSWAAQAVPNRIAVVTPKGSVTYEALAARVLQARRWLAAHGQGDGVVEGRRVFFVPKAHLDDLVLLYALMETGRPVLVGHPRFSPDEQRGLVDRFQPDLVVETAPKTTAAKLVSSGPRSIDSERWLAAFFTSGTTGQPKAVALSRRAFWAAARAHSANLGWQPDDRWLLSIPPAHVGGFSVLTRCLVAQRTVVLAPVKDPDAWFETLSTYRVTLASLVPTQLHRILRAHPKRRPPASLRAVLLGGAAAAPELVAEARQAGWPILTTYGLTEACAQVATEGPKRPGPMGTSGRPLEGVQVRIENDRIFVRGPTVMSGYLTGPTAFTPLATDGWLDTGDRGAWVDGHLQVWGRGADLIVTGGENVFPREVETGLRALEGVEDALVFGVPDPEWGAVVAAAVVLKPGASLDAVKAKATQGTGFKRPRRWMVVDAIPLTRSGKPDRKGAKEKLLRAPSKTVA